MEPGEAMGTGRGGWSRGTCPAASPAAPRGLPAARSPGMRRPGRKAGAAAAGFALLAAGARQRRAAGAGPEGGSRDPRGAAASPRLASGGPRGSGEVLGAERLLPGGCPLHRVRATEPRGFPNVFVAAISAEVFIRGREKSPGGWGLAGILAAGCLRRWEVADPDISRS